MNNKFMEWLTNETKGWLPVIGYAAFAAIIVIAMDYTVRNALINWGVLAGPEIPKDGVYPRPFERWNFFMFLGMFIWAPLKEEIFHRVVPLGFLTAFLSKTPKAIFWLNTLFAVIFGAIHPHYYGIEGKILVGISGFFFGLVFLKCGGLNRSYFKAAAAAMLVHGLTNLFMVLDVYWQYFELR